MNPTFVFKTPVLSDIRKVGYLSSRPPELELEEDVDLPEEELELKLELELELELDFEDD